MNLGIQLSMRSKWLQVMSLNFSSMSRLPTNNPFIEIQALHGGIVGGPLAVHVLKLFQCVDRPGDRTSEFGSI
jgi:translation initiation factor 2 gamma subunit (eIF-2gamma)